MHHPVDEARTRAEILHHQMRNDHRALGRLRALPRFRRVPYEALTPEVIRRADCLALVAHEMGFSDWPAAKRALDGQHPIEDFGALLCPRRCSAHFNLWYRDYDEAAGVRAERNGYLLGFRRGQYVVVDHFYIETLGLDPADPDWEALGRDWVRPADPAARTRLYGKLIAALPRVAEGRFDAV